MSEAYLVPYERAESEFVEKRSRFIGQIARVETEAEARAFIDAVKKTHYDARHNCWCYRLRSGAVRYSDDGEPQGTAGQPMLNVFAREGVENVVCVVTRYFGGILLGAGGLTRAYAKSAKDALDASGVSRVCTWHALRVNCPYPLLERVKLRVLSDGGMIESTEFGATVALTLLLPQEKKDGFAAFLTELTAGSVAPEELGERFLPGPRER